MKLFIKNTLVFSGFCLVLLMAIQFFVSLHIKGKVIDGYGEAQLKSNGKPTLLLLGSSRCRVHFDPVFFNGFGVNSLNLGVNGHTEIAMITIRLKQFVANNNPPDYVIINLDPLVSEGDIYNNTIFIEKDKFARFAFFNNQKDSSIVHYFKFTSAEKYVPLYALFRYGVFWDCIFRANSDYGIEGGYEEHGEHWNTVAKPVTDTIRRYFIKPTELPGIIKAMADLKKTCSGYHIKLLCIQTPIYGIAQNDVAFSYPGMICKVLNIPYIDMNKDSLRYDINNFYNIDHLNSDGVKKMNQHLSGDSTLLSFFR